MPITSKLTAAIPDVSIPKYVFKSPTALLPDTPLIISAESPDSEYLTLSSYRSLSQRLAAGLKHAGLQVGDRVLLASSNTVHSSVIFMGTIMAGGVFVGAQATYDVDDLSRQLQQTEPRFVLVGDKFGDSMPEAAQRIGLPRESLYQYEGDVEPKVVKSGLTHWTDLLASDSIGREYQWEDLSSEEAASCLASLIYSSGTSGAPKGVETTHRQQIAAVAQEPLVLTASANATTFARSRPIALCHMSFSGIVAQSLGYIAFPSLNMPFLVPRRADFVSVIDNIAKFSLASVAIDSSFLIALLKEPSLRSRLTEIASLKVLTVIGSPIGYRQVCDFRALWKESVAVDIRINNAYGMTELGGGILTHSLNDQNLTPPIADALQANVTLKIMALNGRTELPDGEEGELWIHGPNVVKNYWRNPETTAEAFTEDGWIKTGDLARITEQKALCVIGRKKEVIVTRTGIVAPSRIEEILLAHRDVKQAVVCGVPEKSAQAEDKGEEKRHQHIRAYIVKGQEAELTEEDVLQYLQESGWDVHTAMGGVKFVASIPKTSNHKPIRRLLLREDNTSKPTKEDYLRML